MHGQKLIHSLDPVHGLGDGVDAVDDALVCGLADQKPFAFIGQKHGDDGRDCSRKKEHPPQRE